MRLEFQPHLWAKVATVARFSTSHNTCDELKVFTDRPLRADSKQEKKKTYIAVTKACLCRPAKVLRQSVVAVGNVDLRLCTGPYLLSTHAPRRQHGDRYGEGCC